MSASRFKLKSFLNQRLFVTGEEIFGEMERTITSARHGAGMSRSTEGVEGVRPRMEAARPLTSSTTEPGDQCNPPLMQQNPGHSTPDKTNLSPGAQLPGLSQTSTGLDCNNWNISTGDTDKIFQIKEELLDESQTQEIVFPSPVIIKSEQDQQEMQVSHEMQPGSWNCSAAKSEKNDSDEELVNRKGEPTKTVKEDGQISQGKLVNDNNGQAVLPNKKLSTKNLKDIKFCHLCGKSFNGTLIKHIKTHQALTDCDVCGTKFKNTKLLVTHLKHFHKNTFL
nr:PREDICTED: uncharacterized protein LOC109638653 [Paralichthys olivaceus]